MIPPVEGRLFEAGQSKSVPARLVRGTGGALSLHLGDRLESLKDDDLRVTDRLHGVARRVQFRDGRCFETQDDDGLDALFRAATGRTRGSRIASLEIWRPRLFAVLSVLLLAVIVSLRWGVPLAADTAASLVPASIEARLGQESFEAMDDWILEPTSLDEARQMEIQALYDELLAASTLTSDVELRYRGSPEIGPNAFAFPGGPIVVLDGLVKLAPSDAALAGVLAHEIAHVEERHSLKRLARAAGFAIILAVTLGDAGAILEETAALPAIMLDSAYSRDFEREADDRGIELMRAVGHDPKAFQDMLARFAELCGGECPSGWLSSHPSTAERIERVGN